MTDNELIAEFMGAKDYKHESGVPHYYFSVRPHSRTNTIRRKSSLEYHTSWNWLMPVVEKIEGIGYITSITTGSCVICAGSDLEKREDVSLFAWHSGVNYNSKLKNTFEAVVEFIKWYNENK